MSLMTKDKIQLLTSASQVAPYVDQIIALADANKRSLGFLQKAVFHEQAAQGRLWVAVSDGSGECLGYLLFGGRYPGIRIFQLYVQKAYQRLGVGQSLISALTTWAEKADYLIISARVAADLSANRFWERAGFGIVRQEPGGRSSNRVINIRIKELATPSLLGMMSCKAPQSEVGLKHIYLAPRPIMEVQTYVIDINIFFDIVKKRVHRTEAARLISEGLSRDVRVFVTPEFMKELERNSVQGVPDPVLEFARALPVLPEINPEQVAAVLPEIGSIVFPNGVSSGRQAAQDLSDLTHLAYCIHHRATGFITREKAILASGEQLLETYFLEILSPADLIYSAQLRSRERGPVRAHLGTERVSIEPTREAQRGEVERFLIAHGVSREDLSAIWHPGATSSPRRRVAAREEGKLIAAASWDNPQNIVRTTVLHLYVEEQSPHAETVIDHVLEAALRDGQPNSVRIVMLGAAIEQTKTRITAAKRGFLKSFPGGEALPTGQLTKLSFNGLISPDNWSVFCADVAKATGLRLPIRLPTPEEFNNTGIVIKNQSDTFTCELSLFDFETLVSPGVVLCPGRAGLIVPIQLRFAKSLFSNVQPQEELFPAPEALLHVEKAYFRSPKNTSKFNRGTLVLFYLSGSGGGTKEAIGCARITYSEVLAVEEIELTLVRQGVLSRSELENIADKKGRLHVFTFDNLNTFPTRIPFDFLKSRGMISGSNLVTAEEISSKHCVQVCQYGFGLRSLTHA